MRYCIYCKKPMHTSSESIWIAGKNFDIHVPCKKKAESKCNNCGARRIVHVNFYNENKRGTTCPHRKSMGFANEVKTE